MATILRVRSVIGLNAGAVSCLVTTYWDSTGAAIGALATESVARVRAAFNAAAGAIGNTVTYSPTLIVDEVEETTGAIVNQITAAAPAATAGLSAGLPLPLQTMLVAQYQTNTFLRGRRLRGRSYIPGWTVGAMAASGLPVAAAINSVAAWNTALGTTILTPTNQRVWSRPVKLPVFRAGLSAPVSVRAVNGQFAVMRSRRR